MRCAFRFFFLGGGQSSKSREDFVPTPDQHCKSAESHTVGTGSGPLEPRGVVISS